MSSPPSVLVWFRQDLRLSDNPWLSAAVASGLPIVPVYLWHPDEAGEWAMGAASRVWLSGSLKSLKADLQARGSDLVLRQGPATQSLIQLAQACNARHIYCNARYEPWARAQQEQAQRELLNHGIQLHIHTGGTLLWEPDTVTTQQGKPYQVFTPFFNRCLSCLPETEPLHAPNALRSPPVWPESLSVDALPLLPTATWDTEIRAAWQPGESQATQCLEAFLENGLLNYAQDRDAPFVEGTSRLSPYLAFGEISPRQIWQAVEHFSAELRQQSPGLGKAAPVFLRELVWREFAYHVLYHFPHTVQQPLKAKFQDMPWRADPEKLSRWQKGQTGYPLVDAGMRQLWRTGWMHNRVRMIVGSFLTKDLLLPWQEGTRWFWDTLVDADLANNSLSWQWVAGCGADAQPFFRIFNPTSQSAKFDSSGEYIRRWVPELATLSAPEIHVPWRAKHPVAERLYPKPIVDHAEARQKALYLFEQIK